MPCFAVQGDLRLTDDETGFVATSGLARLAQRIRIGLQTPLGYWRWDTTIGVPITNVEKLTRNVLLAMIRRYLLSFDEIVRVSSLSVTVDSSGLANVTYAAITNAAETLQDTFPFQVIS
jgi:hypothetical protein